MQKLAYYTIFFLCHTLNAKEHSTPLFQGECLPEQEFCTTPTVKEERELFSKINSENRRLYNSLDCEAKNRAHQLSKTYSDKNAAIQDAAKEMARKQALIHENSKTHEERLRERGGQQYYDNRYGY